MKQSIKLQCQCNSIEFKLIYTTDEEINQDLFYCPFCSSEIDMDDNIEEEDYDN